MIRSACLGLVLAVLLPLTAYASPFVYKGTCYASPAAALEAIKADAPINLGNELWTPRSSMPVTINDDGNNAPSIVVAGYNHLGVARSVTFYSYGNGQQCTVGTPYPQQVAIAGPVSLSGTAPSGSSGAGDFSAMAVQDILAALGMVVCLGLGIMVGKMR